MSHPTAPLFQVQYETPQKLVEDYLIVPQNSLDRPTWYASNDLYTGLATSLETDFGFNAFDFFLPIGGGPPLHYHVYENEAWYGIEGDLLFAFGNQSGEQGTEPEYTLNVPAETLVFGPRLRPHTYNNIDSTDATIGENVGARTLSFTTPGGLDLFFDYVGIPVEDRNSPIPIPGPPTPEILAQLVEIGARTSGAPYFILPESDYTPPEDVLNYVVVLPENPDANLLEAVLPLANVEGFSIWQITDDPNVSLPTRPTFTGPFNIEYTSLLALEETGNELEYNQFSLAPQASETKAFASLSDNQVVEPTESLATGIANLQFNEAGEIEYSLTVSGLDFGSLMKNSSPQTPDNEIDDVTAIHIHSGDRGISGSHMFKILDPQEQNEQDLDIVRNDDSSITISGTWENAEAEIPTNLTDFINSNGLPGEESDFYVQVHTKGNPEGEIRGQIALTTEDFPDQIVSEDYEAFYVREGALSFKINDEVRLAEADTLVYVAPGNEYSFANFGEETVESLAITIAKQEELLANPGDNLLNALKSQDKRFRIEGSPGNDELFAKHDSVVVGGSGNDILRVTSGGNNILIGNEGKDQFWLANGTLPDTITETRQLTDLGLPNLEDTRNTIADFELGVDKIGIAGVPGVSSFNDLKLLPAFDDIKSTSIVTTVDGIEGEVSLGNVAGILLNQLSADDFVFA